MIKSRPIKESITHIEDLPLVDKVDKSGKLVQKNFIDRIAELAKMRITEKLDGSFLRFGIDNDGKFYTTRDGKGLFYKTSDWGVTTFETQGMVGFKGAHLALKEHLSLIKKVMPNGTAMDIEILFGKQPNAITYGIEGFNYIAFLKSAVGTDDTIKADQTRVGKLVDALKDQTSNVKLNILDTDDGIKITKTLTDTAWKFTSAKTIDGKKIDDVNIKEELAALKSFLSKKNSAAKEIGLDMTNFQVATANLTSIDRKLRDAIADEREALNGKIMNDFKLSIKEKLLKNFVKKVKPGINDKQGINDSDIEGVVLLDPDTDEQIKIVDKDVFTAVNTFNQSVRKELKGAVRTTDPNASIDSRGGLLGDTKIRIANMFGISELARSASAKQVFGSYKGADVSETVNNFVKSLSHANENAYRRKISAILDNSINVLSEKLSEFKQNYQSYKLTLKSGAVVGYSPETVKRTLLAFAETRRTLTDLKKQIDSSRSMADIVNALFGKHIEMIHTEQQVAESLDSIESNYAQTGDSRTKIVQGMGSQQIIDAYLATYLASLILLRAGDKTAAKMLRDPSHARLDKYSATMSSLNFWGYVAMEPRKSASLHNKKVQGELDVISQRILSSRLREIHSPINASTNLTLNWDRVDDNLRVLMLRLERRTATNIAIRVALLRWDSIDGPEKTDALSKAFYYLMRSDPGSNLLSRLRATINAKQIHITNEGLIADVAKLHEDGEGGDAGAPAADVSEPAMTTASSIANYPFRLFKGKVVRRVPRKMSKKNKLSKDKGGFKRFDELSRKD